MRATFKGALAALAAVALAGCSQTGAQSPTEAPSASLSPEVRQLVGVMTSETRAKLLAAAEKFDADHCEVHIQRNNATPEWSACLDTRNDLAGLAGRLEDDLTMRQAPPAELDDLVTRTSHALQGVRATAKNGTDPKLLTLSLQILRGNVQEWSALKG